MRVARSWRGRATAAAAPDVDRDFIGFPLMERPRVPPPLRYRSEFAILNTRCGERSTAAGRRLVWLLSEPDVRVAVLALRPPVHAERTLSSCIPSGDGFGGREGGPGDMICPSNFRKLRDYSPV